MEPHFQSVYASAQQSVLLVLLDETYGNNVIVYRMEHEVVFKPLGSGQFTYCDHPFALNAH